MANIYDKAMVHNVLIGGQGFSGTSIGFALNSNYLLQTNGACLGIRFPAPPGNVHIDYVYFFLHAADATGYNLTCDIANYGVNTGRAGTSIRAVTAAGGIVANKWVKFDFTGFEDVLTGGNYYWIVIGDAAGGDGHGYQVKSRGDIGFQNSPNWWNQYTSTTGFTSVPTTVQNPAVGIIVFSDGTVFGNPYTQAVTGANNTLERGLKISGLTEQLKISALSFTGHANMSTLQIYEGNTAPGGAVWSGFNGGAAYTLSANEKAIGYCWLANIVTLAKETVYRITFKHSSNNTAPGYNEVEDQATPGQHAIDCSLAQGRYVRTIDNGAGGWTDNDGTGNLLYLPRMSVHIYDQIAIAAGGSTGKISMTGGMMI